MDGILLLQEHMMDPNSTSLIRFGAWLLTIKTDHGIALIHHHYMEK